MAGPEAERELLSCCGSRRRARRMAGARPFASESEKGFGHIFIVCATGRSGEEMLDLCRRRLHNDPATELRVAAEEQRKIMRLRLERMLRP